MTAETTVEATPEPTAKPEPAFTPEAETTPEATESKSEINENDSQTSEGEAIEDNVEQTTSNSDSVDDIASAKSYTLSEQEKADLRALGATEEQINNVKSGQDFIDLVYKLVNGDSTGSSTAGGVVVLPQALIPVNHSVTKYMTLVEIISYMQMTDLYMVGCDYIIINAESDAYTASLSAYSGMEDIRGHPLNHQYSYVYSHSYQYST